MDHFITLHLLFTSTHIFHLSLYLIISNVIPCSCNGNTIRIDPRDATRPVLAALLQSIWGIAPTYLYYSYLFFSYSPHLSLLLQVLFDDDTHQTWNQVLKRVESNYLWSLSLTPFAPFSIHTNLSFAHVCHLINPNPPSTDPLLLSLPLSLSS